MKRKWLVVILIVCLIFAPTTFACKSGDRNDSDSGKSDSSDSSSSSSNSGSDKSSGVSSGDSGRNDRNGPAVDCDPYGIFGPLCPKETESGVNND